MIHRLKIESKRVNSIEKVAYTEEIHDPCIWNIQTSALTVQGFWKIGVQTVSLKY